MDIGKWVLAVVFLAFTAYAVLSAVRVAAVSRRQVEALQRIDHDLSELMTERDGLQRALHAAEAQHAETQAELVKARAASAQLRTERDAIYWLRWWVRNAIEAPHHDPARSFYLRWAIAGHFASDFETLHRDLLRVANDQKRTETERIHARAFASELEATHRMPWEAWAETGKPPHNASAVQAAYFAALESWPLLLGTPQEG